MLVNVVNELFGQEYKVEIILYTVVLPLITNSSHFLDVGPRGHRTAKCEDSANCGRKHSTNIFGSQN